LAKRPKGYVLEWDTKGTGFRVERIGGRPEPADRVPPKRWVPPKYKGRRQRPVTTPLITPRHDRPREPEPRVDPFQVVAEYPDGRVDVVSAHESRDDARRAWTAYVMTHRVAGRAGRYDIRNADVHVYVREVEK
jgi:hypothetical protein